MADFITLNAINLPVDLHWSDEFDSNIEQSINFAFAGNMYIFESEPSDWLYMTLTGQGEVWIDRLMLLDLQAEERTPQNIMTLTLGDDRQYDAMWRRLGTKPIDVEPVEIIEPPPDDLNYKVIALRFLVKRTN